MKITVIMLRYWKERYKNIKTIKNDLNSGSRKPDKIIVFNNRPINYGCRVRHAIALLEPSDYYYFIDDDTTVCKNTLKNFAKYASKWCCLGYRGKILTSTYKNSEDILGSQIIEAKKVDLLTGNGTMFIPRAALLNMFSKINYKYKEDDLTLSMTNKSMVIPAKEDEFIKNLPDGGVGCCNDKNHWESREAYVKKLIS